MFYYVFVCMVLVLMLVFYSIFIWDSIFSTLNIKYIDVPTSGRARKNIEALMADLGMKEGVFYDLGSGHGGMAIAVKRAFPQMDVYGFDRSRTKVVFSRIRARFSGAQVVFKRADIFNIDVSGADIIFTYLWQPTMKRLKEKLEKEAKEGAFIISSTFPIYDWNPVAVKETLTIKRDPAFEKIYIYQR